MSFPPTQFASGDWALEVCNGSEYLVYCDSALPSFERLEYWYQWLNLSLAATAILLPGLVWISKRLHKSWRQWKLRRPKAVPKKVCHNILPDEIDSC